MFLQAFREEDTITHLLESLESAARQASGDAAKGKKAYSKGRALLEVLQTAAYEKRFAFSKNG